jgi:hypothetical protein
MTPKPSCSQMMSGAQRRGARDVLTVLVLELVELCGVV